jgi:hypothetical protein
MPEQPPDPVSARLWVALAVAVALLVAVGVAIGLLS